MRRIIDNVEIISRGINDLTDDEIRKYIQYVYDNAEYTEYDKLESLKLTLCPDGKIDIDYKFNGQKFERIRRITGKP